jgi:hypothetical protein
MNYERSILRVLFSVVMLAGGIVGGSYCVFAAWQHSDWFYLLLGTLIFLAGADPIVRYWRDIRNGSRNQTHENRLRS